MSWLPVKATMVQSNRAVLIQQAMDEASGREALQLMRAGILHVLTQYLLLDEFEPATPVVLRIWLKVKYHGMCMARVLTTHGALQLLFLNGARSARMRWGFP